MIVHTSAAKCIQVAVLFAMAALLLTTAAVITASPAAAQEEPHRRTVSVSGEGIVRVQPDMATVHFGIVTTADDPETARARNAEASSRTMNAVRALGIEERYIRLESLRLQPHREWVDDRRRYEERGYEASRLVVVEIHDIDTLPILVAEVVEQGANRLERVAYDLEDRDQARNDALREAVNNARDKARIVAATLGEELGRIQSINEQSFDFPRPQMRLEASADMAAQAAAPEPDAYAAGELEVRVTVHASFELE